MKKQIIILLFIILAGISCNSSNDSAKLFNHFIISQTKLNFGKYPGVQSFEETNHFDTTLFFQKRELLFFDLFDPSYKYITSMNEDGSVKELKIDQITDVKISYQYNKKGLLKSINGSLPYPIQILIDYQSGHIKSIYYEGIENNLFEYSDDYTNISCFNFELPDKTNGKMVKKGDLLRKYSIEKKDDQQYIINELDSKSGNNIKQFQYNKLNLEKEVFADGKTIEYEYEKFGNIKSIIVKNADNSVEKFDFSYVFDSSDNWTKRIIKLGSIELLVSERNIKYFQK